jgi:hypothetical protein
MGCERLPIRQFEPLSRRSRLRPVATRCVRLALSEEGLLVKSSLLVRLLSRSRTVGCSFLSWRLVCTPCRWELSRFLISIRGRQAAKAKRELAETESPAVDLGAGLKGSLRESMCQAVIRIFRATAALAELWLPERPLTSR